MSIGMRHIQYNIDSNGAQHIFVCFLHFDNLNGFLLLLLNSRFMARSHRIINYKNEICSYDHMLYVRDVRMFCSSFSHFFTFISNVMNCKHFLNSIRSCSKNYFVWQTHFAPKQLDKQLLISCATLHFHICKKGHSDVDDDDHDHVESTKLTLSDQQSNVGGESLPLALRSSIGYSDYISQTHIDTVFIGS